MTAALVSAAVVIAALAIAAAIHAGITNDPE